MHVGARPHPLRPDACATPDAAAATRRRREASARPAGIDRCSATAAGIPIQPVRTGNAHRDARRHPQAIGCRAITRIRIGVKTVA